MGGGGGSPADKWLAGEVQGEACQSALALLWRWAGGWGCGDLQEHPELHTELTP